MKLKYFYFACTLFIFHFAIATQPNLVIVLSIDQLSYQTLANIKPYCTGGLRTLLDKGIVYTNAQWPHALPSTGPGHTSLSTGALPSAHGIIDNAWVNNAGKRVCCDDDERTESAVITRDGGSYPYGKSAHNIMVDTLSDQLMFQSTSVRTHKTVAISLKSRAAIAMAGHCGQPFWVDDEKCFFTSSKAYMQTLPEWLQRFNNHIDISTTYTWRTTYALNHPAYQWANKRSYDHSEHPSVIDTTIDVTSSDNMIFTPLSHRLLLHCAYECLRTQLPQTSGTFILWLGVSCTDRIGHTYGTQSIEYLDMFYKFDSELATFMNTVFKLNTAEKTLFVLTADHGSMPLPELLHEKGFTQAQRLNIATLKDDLNKLVQENFGIEHFIVDIDTPDIYFNPLYFRKMSPVQQKKVVTFLKKWLQEHPLIRNVWTSAELSKASFTKDDVRWFFQNQVYPGRSGDLVFQILPYVHTNTDNQGAGHRSPYNYDRQIPLIFYQQNVLPALHNNSIIYGQQVAPTLASILNIPRPSCATFEVVPDINYKLYVNNNHTKTVERRLP